MSGPSAVVRDGRVADGRRYRVRPSRGDDSPAVVVLRDSVAAEGPFIAALPGERSWVEEDLALAALVAEGGLSLILEVDGVVAGHLMVRRRRGPHYGHTGEIAVIVHNMHRGAGLGRALMEAAIDWARRAGMARLSLGVFPSNEAAIGLYRSLGFVEEGVARREVRMPDGDHDLVLMGLLL